MGFAWSWSSGAGLERGGGPDHTPFPLLKLGRSSGCGHASSSPHPQSHLLVLPGLFSLRKVIFLVALGTPGETPGPARPVSSLPRDPGSLDTVGRGVRSWLELGTGMRFLARVLHTPGKQKIVCLFFCFSCWFARKANWISKVSFIPLVNGPPAPPRPLPALLWLQLLHP